MSEIAPHLFVIFGATGDLTHRKLLPALYRLMEDKEGADQCYVLGVSRSDWDNEQFREEACAALVEHGFPEDNVQAWSEHLFYNGLGKKDQDYDSLKQQIEKLEKKLGLSGNRVFYLSLPPSAYEVTITALGECGLNQSDGWTRLVIEKPFGKDLESAQHLNNLIHDHFDEEQVYRIDHYLGKETVQNLLAFRFANMLFESTWHRDRIERVEITVAEDLGLGSRAGYYDKAGALRDMIQNHLTQLFTLIAMEVPSSFSANAIRREKIKVLESVQPIDLEKDVVFGQYTAGKIDDEKVMGYDDEDGIAGDSDTETYVALQLFVENWRWQGVPFVLRTGKRLPTRLTQIAVCYRCAPFSIFKPYEDSCSINPNILLITLQPNEGFALRFEVKAPGEPFNLQTQQLKFRYEEAFGPLPEAYETLLFDVLTGDQTLFVHAQEAEAAWALYTPLLEANIPVHDYRAGSWGPEQADTFVPNWITGVTLQPIKSKVPAPI